MTTEYECKDHGNVGTAYMAIKTSEDSPEVKYCFICYQVMLAASCHILNPVATVRKYYLNIYKDRHGSFIPGKVFSVSEQEAKSMASEYAIDMGTHADEYVVSVVIEL